jgi:hypothetical protein
VVGLALRPEPRPKARRPPTRFDARGDEPRQTEFDLQGQHFVGTALIALSAARVLYREIAAQAASRTSSGANVQHDALRRTGRLERRRWQAVYERGRRAALCRRHLRAGLRVLSGTGNPDGSRTLRWRHRSRVASQLGTKRIRAALKASPLSSWSAAAMHQLGA